MASVLVFGLVEAGKLTPSSIEALSVANVLAGSAANVTGALLGSGLSEAAKQFSAQGMGELLLMDDPTLADYVGERYAQAASAIIGQSGAEIIIAPTNTESVEWISRAAAELDASLAPGCLKLEVNEGGVQATRVIGGGSLLATYRLERPLKMALLSPAATGPSMNVAQGSIRAVAAPPPLPAAATELLEMIPDAAGSGPPLKTAKVVVAGGMGVGSAANWKLIEEMAVALGAAVGASRAAVDVGWAPSSKQVGFSGLKIKPDLYIAIGISGAIHHLAGIGGAKRVVAINKDSESSIFKAAHLGVVGDLHQIIPAFVARVKELKAG
jgi:electron transfer flavoprotein alpha subunit